MFKVECPSCKAPYQVDERRVPPSGLKMRCPKCGTSFQVDPPAADPRRTGPSPVLGAAPPRPPPRPRAPTMLGVAPGFARPPSAAPPPVPPRADELDLAGGVGDDDLGLPVVAPAPRAQPPAPVRPPAEDEVDLPGLVGSPPARSRFQDHSEVDLGADLDVDLPAAVTPSGRASDLPSPRVSDRPPAGARLPAPAEFELPSPRGAGADVSDLPSAAGARVPGGGFGDLPSPAGRFSDLPSPGRDLGELPVVGTGAWGDAPDLPVVGVSRPAAAAPPVPPPHRGSVTQPAVRPPVAIAASAEASPLPFRPPAPSLPEIPAAPPSLHGPGGVLSRDLDTEPPPRPPSLPAPAPPGLSSEPPAPAAVTRQAGGGTSFGEVDLGGAEAEKLASDDMEFGAIPQERNSLPGVPVAAVSGVVAGVGGPASLSPPGPAAAPLPAPVLVIERPRRRIARWLLGVLAMCVIGGGALALVPTVGPFGIYWIGDRLRAKEYEQLVVSTAAAGRAELARDVFSASRAAAEGAEAARSRSRRVPGLAAWAAYVVLQSELRFGSDSERSARAQVALQQLAEVRDVPFLALARAAQAATAGQLPRARHEAERLLQASPRDADALALLGEVELRAKDAAAAGKAFARLAEVEPAARAAFGVARALLAAGDVAGAERSARAALEKEPTHVGARTLLARVAWKAGQDQKALELLESVVAPEAPASPEERVRAHTLLGDVHMGRSRVTHAEQAYGAALAIDPKAGGALLGLGDALYRSGRYSEALARFQAATQSNPDDVDAQLGVAKTTIALERLQDAKTMLAALRKAHPKSWRVAYWDGKVQEALGNREEAEAAYRAAVEGAAGDSDAIDAWVALAMLQNQQGQTDLAQKTLATAREKLPESAAIHEALGELALLQGRNEEAVRELSRALELDPEDVGARFKLGVAHRRSRAFDKAQEVFDAVAKVDRDYPGLALERGLLFEASGRTEEALKAYEAALAKAPNDPDLMLRVGCGKVSAGRPEQAAELLRKVLQQRQQSAETHHCLGRALLLEGKNLADALRMLERAVEIDPHRAEYHLLVGWAANETGNVAKAEASLQRALELDRGLADAYWQRGVLRYRQGAVKDAVADLQRALELRPSRFEAHASLADSYYDLGREAEALAEWRLAVEAQPENATWRYRYGKLLAANRRNAEAQEQLRKAIEHAALLSPKPRWLPDAHLHLARAMGARAEAIPHWEAFLRDGPRDSPYRPEARQVLAGLGRPWSGD